MSDLGRRFITEGEWRELCEQLPPRCSVRDLDEGLVEGPVLGEEERAALWLYVWSRGAPAGARPPASGKSHRPLGPGGEGQLWG